MKLHTLALLAAMLTAVAHAQPSGNSVVRFRIHYGTTFFGDVDVELFDQDKPLTVANFLANVQNGVYDNSILHDLRPGFSLQGGSGRVANPFSNEPFELIARIPTNAPVPNEFGVGTLRSNVLGTLAMSKNPGDTDSASAAWFFNLGNNSDGFGVTNLDAALGGYVVFGTVKAGLKVLTYFNTFTADDGIEDMTDDFHVDFCPPLRLYPDDAAIGFDALPVGFFGQDCIRYNDLFNVQVIMLSGPDVAPPRITSVLPAADTSIVGALTLSGAATDNIEVQTVRVYVNTNLPVTATGTWAWSVELDTLVPGTNVVVVEAIDATGNRAQLTRRFFKSVPVPFTLLTVGSGTVTGPADGALLEVARGYSVTAKAAPGYLFAGWTGTINQASATLPFLMEAGFQLTAIFVTNPFPSVKGTFNGLFYNPDQVEQQSSGFLTLTLGDLGAYSAKLLMNHRSYSLSGRFSVDGGETNLLFRTGTNALLVRMLLDVTGGSDQINGSITNNQLAAVDTNAGWFATLKADRAVFTSANPSPLAGRYTVLIPADPDAPGPDGAGFAQLSVTTKGVASFGGTLADGTKAVQKVPVSKDGALPFYVSLYKDKGAAVSWLTFDTTQPTTDLSGLLNWFKQTQPTAKFYPHGFTNESTVAGSRYTPPASGVAVLDLPDAVVGFTGGNLTADFANNVTWGTDNKIVNQSPDRLTLTVQKSTGLFTGSVTPPGGPARSIKGAVLQKQNRGAGFLLGTDQSSGVTIDEP